MTLKELQQMIKEEFEEGSSPTYINAAPSDEKSFYNDIIINELNTLKLEIAQIYK